MVPEGVDVFQVLDRRQWILSSRLGFVLERDQLFALGKRSDGPWNEYRAGQQLHIVKLWNFL